MVELMKESGTTVGVLCDEFYDDYEFGYLREEAVIPAKYLVALRRIADYPVLLWDSVRVWGAFRVLSGLCRKTTAFRRLRSRAHNGNSK